MVASTTWRSAGCLGRGSGEGSNHARRRFRARPLLLLFTYRAVARTTPKDLMIWVALSCAKFGSTSSAARSFFVSVLRADGFHVPTHGARANGCTDGFHCTNLALVSRSPSRRAFCLQSRRPGPRVHRRITSQTPFDQSSAVFHPRSVSMRPCPPAGFFLSKRSSFCRCHDHR